MFPVARAPDAGARRQPQRRPAADAHPRRWPCCSRPRLLMIDELSLGLAPSVVAELLVAVQRLKEQGTTVILVEQSVNVALTVAETAYFMEKGEIRFHGPTSELLDRPDVLRSVFLEGAATRWSWPSMPPPSCTSTATSPGVAVSASGRAPTATTTCALGACAGCRKHFGGIAALDDVSLRRRRRARSSGSSARTAPARPRSSTCCPGSRPRARARSSSRAPPSSASDPMPELGSGSDGRSRTGGSSPP